MSRRREQLFTSSREAQASLCCPKTLSLHVENRLEDMPVIGVAVALRVLEVQLQIA
jgi:hypothetical protein